MQIGAENQIHAMEFLACAYLQIGEDNNAKKMVDEFSQISREDVTKSLETVYFDGRLAYFPAMYALEMHQWKQPLALQPPAGVEPYNQAITYWARAAAAGHLRDLAAVRSALSQYEAMLEATKKGAHAFRAKYMETEQDEADVWLAFLEGRNEDAVDLLGRVADKQD
jgi:hypothetical protein